MQHHTYVEEKKHWKEKYKKRLQWYKDTKHKESDKGKRKAEEDKHKKEHQHDKDKKQQNKETKQGKKKVKKTTKIKQRDVNKDRDMASVGCFGYCLYRIKPLFCCFFCHMLLFYSKVVCAFVCFLGRCYTT